MLEFSRVMPFYTIYILLLLCPMYIVHTHTIRCEDFRIQEVECSRMYTQKLNLFFPTHLISPRIPFLPSSMYVICELKGFPSLSFSVQLPKSLGSLSPRLSCHKLSGFLSFSSLSLLFLFFF